MDQFEDEDNKRPYKVSETIFLRDNLKLPLNV